MVKINIPLCQQSDYDWEIKQSGGRCVSGTYVPKFGNPQIGGQKHKIRQFELESWYA